MQSLLKNWTFMRVIRLVAGGLIIWRSFVDGQPVLGLLGGLFLVQVIFNTGCGPAGCSIPDSRQSIRQSPKKIHHEEV
ncbi:hypothetical protein [Nibrella saemangeumensis]|uniref:hypothetical protein n=1 Tax=Nibrella saemangeumensis TaxID=1084526 RepID=UPI0031E8F736